MSDFINAEIRIDRFNSLIRALKKRSKNLKPVMSVIGNLVVKSVRQNFREEGRHDKWQQSRKPKGRTLLGTGALMKGIHYELDNDGTAVTVKTGPQKYAAIHQFGGTTGAHDIVARNRKALRFTVGGMILYRKSVHHPGSRIPARPYMMLQEEDEKNIEELLIRHLVADL
jgi:phage virion morphogenesis protein